MNFKKQNYFDMTLASKNVIYAKISFDENQNISQTQPK